MQDELITDNVTGILVPPNNPKLLQDAINKLLTDSETAKKLSDAGYEFVINNLTWEVLLPEYVKFYKNLANS